jgi:mono/diheme cytochrome c family protein
MDFGSQTFAWPWMVLVTILLLHCGCGGQPAPYRPNDLHMASLSSDLSELEIRQRASAASEVVESVFGDIDHPRWPEGIDAPMEMAKVHRSAGPVGRDKTKVEYGLFRKHCVQCHGLSGDGVGPAASLLAPYPRDFRRGSYKFKTTPIGKKPTIEDIKKTLENGIPGTSMPSFRPLNEAEEFQYDIDAMAHYVVFLSIRGEVERRVAKEMISQDSSEIPSDQISVIVTRVAGDWSAAGSHVETVPSLGDYENDEERSKAIERGKNLFASELTACVKCHGIEGAGDGISQDFDEWTKDWTIRSGIDPSRRDEWRLMKKYGALKPVVDRARNLKLGAYHGGGDRSDIYRRLALGIEGSPMPAIARKVNDNPGLTEQDVQDLVEFVYSIGSSGKLVGAQ